LNNPNSSCEKRTGVCDVAGIGISCGNPNDCNGLGTNCSVGIADGAQCYAYLVDVERTIDYIRNNKISKIMLQNFTLITNGTLLYNAQTKQCEGYATIPVESGLRDGVYVLVVGVGDRLGNGANSLTEIGRALNERCGCDVYDMCDPECVRDILQDIITLWNLPKIGIDNHAPKVTITSPEPYTLFGGEMIYFSANIIDSEDGSVTSTITSGTPCYITIGGVSLGTVPYDNENRKCQGIVMIPQDEDFPQGEQDLTVKIADNAGNIGEGSISVIVDTVKPILHIIDPINNQFVQGVKQIKFTASDAHLNSASVMISTDNGQTWHSASGGPVTYTYDWDTTKETDGMAYGIIAKATDDAGNTGYSEQVIVIVDNGAPEGVYVLDPTKNEIVQGTINLKAIATDYVSGVESVKIKLESDLEGGGSWSCDATWNGGIWYCGFNSTLMPDGLYWVWAEATDKLGHTTYSAMVPFIIDNHPPEKPQLYVNDPEGDGYDTDGTVTWYWNESTDEGSGVDYYVIDITYSESPQHIQTKVFGTTFTYSDLADGTWQAKVKAVDKAGHESEWSDLVNITVDKTKPSPVSISSSGVENPPYDTDGDYAISWSGGSDTNFDRYELYENDTKTYSGSSNSMSFSKPDGTYEYYVTAYDKAGWTSTSGKLKVTVDTQSPTIQITGTVPGIGFFIATYSVSDASPSSGIDRIEASSNGYALCSGTIPAGFCTVFLGSNLTLTVYDKAGNFGTASTTGQEKDTTPPRITYSSPSGVINYNEITLEVRTDESTQCYYGTEDNITSMVEMDPDGGKLVHTVGLGVLTDGLKVYHVICVDLSGNWMDSSKTIVFYIDTSGNYALTIPDYGHYWSTGWNTFWLPQLILDDICGDGRGPYEVEDVLKSLYNLNGSANFDIIWYFDGSEWLYFMPQYPAYSTLQYFNDQSSLPYYIYMTAEDRLEITQDICPSTIPTTTTIPA
jgi:major membrane immunogen (membrane-anchored lipoprotein)